MPENETIAEEVEQEETAAEEVEPTVLERVLARIDEHVDALLARLDMLDKAIADLSGMRASVAIDNGAEVRTADVDGDGDADTIIEVPEVEDLDLDI